MIAISPAITQTPIPATYQTNDQVNQQATQVSGASGTRVLLKSHKAYFQDYVNEQVSALKHHCDILPASDACTVQIHYMLKVLAKARFRKQLDNSSKLAHTVLDILYNGKNAEALFVTRLHDINSRADFFATNDLYFQQSFIPVRWFKVASQVSKECITGLGAHHCASYVTFASTKTLANPPIYAWRQAAGDTILSASFDNFNKLFNQGTTDPITWDIEQLVHEQRVLQSIHIKYLSKYQIFLSAYNVVMRLRIQDGVDLLSLPSRINYGCYRMGYAAQNGCGL